MANENLTTSSEALTRADVFDRRGDGDWVVRWWNWWGSLLGFRPFHGLARHRVHKPIGPILVLRDRRGDAPM